MGSDEGSHFSFAFNALVEEALCAMTNIKPLFPILQPASGLVRYMTTQNRRDFIEFLLNDITRLKRSNIVSRIVKLFKSMVSKEEQLQDDMRTLQQEAHSAGKEPKSVPVPNESFAFFSNPSMVAVSQCQSSTLSSTSILQELTLTMLPKNFLSACTPRSHL